MERIERQIERRTDALGRQCCVDVRTITIRNEPDLNRMLERLDKSLELVGCANVLCHESHWVDRLSDGWMVTLRARHLRSLREELASRRAGQEELICLSSDRETAREQLLSIQDRLRLPDEAVLRLALDICRALEQTQETGLDRCAVSEDTVYVTCAGRWLLGDTGLEQEGAAGTAGLARLLYRVLGGTEESGEPPLGQPELRRLVCRLCAEEMDVADVRRELEGLAGRAPQPEEPVAVQEPEEDDSALQRLLHALSDLEDSSELQPPVEDSDDDWITRFWQKSAGPDMPLTLEDSRPDMTEVIRKKVNLSSMISTGDGITVALRKNGTVISTRMFLGVDQWKDIRGVAAGGSHMMGLRSDGRVQVAGSNFQGQCEVSDWRDVIQIAAGATHSVGLRADGTVYAVGKITGGQYYVYQWKDIAAVSAGSHHIVGLRKDGTVVAEGSDLFRQCDVNDWEDIVAVSAGGEHTVGLRSDGTVVATGANRSGQCNVSNWTDIIAVDAGFDHTVGLRADGTVVATGSDSYGACAVDGWKDVIAISAGRATTLALRSDGRLLALGKNDHGQCNVGHWDGLI